MQGPGLQHLALKTDDIIATMRKLRRVSECGGFDFMPPLDHSYYECARIYYQDPAAFIGPCNSGAASCL